MREVKGQAVYLIFWPTWPMVELGVSAQGNRESREPGLLPKELLMIKYFIAKYKLERNS